MRNKDDITEAVHALDVFTKNYCLNCKEIKKLKVFIWIWKEKIIELDLEELSKLVKCHEKHITGCDNKCKKCELNPEPMLELICHLAKVVLVLLGEIES